MFTGVDEGVFIQHNERELIASTCKAHQQCIFTTTTVRECFNYANWHSLTVVTNVNI